MLRIYYDEGGVLGRSTKYLQTLHNDGIIIETITECELSSNSKVESLMRTNHQLTPIALAMLALAIELWCFTR